MAETFGRGERTGDEGAGEEDEEDGRPVLIAEFVDSEEAAREGPRPAPILVALFIVFWLCSPFLASIVFFLIILAIVVIADPESELNSLYGSMSSFGETLGLRSLTPLFSRTGPLWDSTIVKKLWNEILESLPATRPTSKREHVVAATHVDWIETGDEHVFKADTPGLRKEDIKVELEGESILKISGERVVMDGDDETRTLHRVERRYGPFLRRIQLPLNAKVDAVFAKVENGVLTVTVPKSKTQPIEVVRAIDVT